MEASARMIAMPVKLLKQLQDAGAEFMEADVGDNMIVTRHNSPAYKVYKSWVESLPENLSDPVVGCFIIPSPSIATSTIAPAFALYGNLQVRGFRYFRGIARFDWHRDLQSQPLRSHSSPCRMRLTPSAFITHPLLLQILPVACCRSSLGRLQDQAGFCSITH